MATDWRVNLEDPATGTFANVSTADPAASAAGLITRNIAPVGGIILGTSTAQIGHVVVDSGSTISANITNASVAVTESGTWIVSTSSSNPARIDPTGTTTQPVSGTVTVGTGSTCNVNVTNASLAVTESGTWIVSTSSSNPARIDPVGTTTQPVSGTVTVGTGSTCNVNVTNASLAVTESGTWIVSTSSLNPARIDPTGTTTQPVSGTVTLGTSTASIGNVTLLAGTASIGILGTSTAQIGRVVIDTGSTVNANVTNASLAVTESGTWIVSTSSSNPARVDPTGTTTQPVSGTVTVGTGSTCNVNVTNASLAVTQSGTWVTSTSSSNPAFTNAFQAGTWIVSTSSSNPAFVSVTAQPTTVLSTSTATIGTVQVTDGTNVLTLSTQNSTTVTGLVGNVPMGIVGDNQPVLTSDTMYPVSITTDGRLRVYQNEDSYLRRIVETQDLLDHPDRMYSRSRTSRDAYNSRAYSR